MVDFVLYMQMTLVIISVDTWEKITLNSFRLGLGKKKNLCAVHVLKLKPTQLVGRGCFSWIWCTCRPAMWHCGVQATKVFAGVGKCGMERCRLPYRLHATTSNLQAQVPYLKVLHLRERGFCAFIL